MERVPEEKTVRRRAWKTSGYKKKRVRPREGWREAMLENLWDKEMADWRTKARIEGAGNE